MMKEKYKIVYADPPWRYNDKSLSHGGGAECHYPTMELKDICGLPISHLADDDCVLFLWVTFPMLNEGLQVIKAWGFDYKTTAFVWIKKNSNRIGYFYGMGRWTRANAEICLLATKGKPKRVKADIHQLIFAPIRNHSQKPDEVRLKIVELCGDLPRIELFARDRFVGWDVWGNKEILGTQQLLYNEHP